MPYFHIKVESNTCILFINALIMLYIYCFLHLFLILSKINCFYFLLYRLHCCFVHPFTTFNTGSYNSICQSIPSSTPWPYGLSKVRWQWFRKNSSVLFPTYTFVPETVYSYNWWWPKKCRQLLHRPSRTECEWLYTTYRLRTVRACQAWCQHALSQRC